MLVDANLLRYAVDASSPFHRPASDWMTDQLNGSRRVGLPWQSLVAFVRIVRHLALYSADSDFARFPEVRWINPLA